MIQWDMAPKDRGPTDGPTQRCWIKLEEKVGKEVKIKGCTRRE